MDLWKLFLFVTIWPPAWNGTFEGYWTIHGIWPEFSNGSWPEYCNVSARFDMYKLDPIIPQLEMYWTDFTTEPQKFWKHEYEKHATCAKDTLLDGELRFFEAGLMLRKKYSMYEMLKEIGVVSGACYFLDEIETKFVRQYGFRPIITCIPGTKWMLQDIRICLNLMLQTMNCTSQIVKSESCDDGIFVY